MDLAEIRKKAQEKEAIASAEATAESTLPTELLADEPEHANDFILPIVQEMDSSSLQQVSPDFEFATEEEYMNGISGTEQANDIETVQWLAFMLGQEEYALSLDVVLELIKPRDFTELPKVPEYVQGILSLRGEVVPVIDLRQRLKLGVSEVNAAQRIIVCEGEEQPIGLLIDRITQVVRIQKDAIEPAPIILVEGEKDFVAGVGRYNGRMLILLDPEEVLRIDG